MPKPRDRSNDAAVRHAYETGVLLKLIEADYGLTRTQIMRIVGKPLRHKPVNHEPIRAMLREGARVCDIRRATGASRNTIERVRAALIHQRN